MTKEDFTAQVLSLEKRMYCIAKSILHNDADCADAMQNAILSAFVKLHTLREEKYFKTWLIRILINECYDLLHDQKDIVPYEEYMTEEVVGAEDVSDSTGEGLTEAIERLDERYRIPCVLYYLSGYRVNEISRILKIPESTVKVRLHRGRKKLREYLEEVSDYEI